MEPKLKIGDSVIIKNSHCRDGETGKIVSFISVNEPAWNVQHDRDGNVIGHYEKNLRLREIDDWRGEFDE